MNPESERSTLHQVAEALQRSRRLLITAHPDPDGDAIGSMAAAYVALSSDARRSVVPFNPDPVPRRFRFLAGTSAFVQDLGGQRFDTTLLLDCSDQRIFHSGKLCREQMGTVVVVDHHKTPETVGDLVLRDPSAAAVGVLLYQIFRRLGVDLQPVAEALFCSIMSDTGSFRYQNTNPEAMTVAGELLALGVNPWQVASRLYESRPHREVELLGLVLRTLQVSADGRCAALTVTQEMLDRCGCPPEVTDGLINYARGVDGVEVAILLRPRPEGTVRVSFRSRGQVDVSRIAERFGGGGHRNAAGCTLHQSPEKALAVLFGEVQRLLHGDPLPARGEEAAGG